MLHAPRSTPFPEIRLGNESFTVYAAPTRQHISLCAHVRLQLKHNARCSLVTQPCFCCYPRPARVYLYLQTPILRLHVLSMCSFASSSASAFCPAYCFFNAPPIFSFKRRPSRKKHKQANTQRPQVTALVTLHPISNLPGRPIVQRSFQDRTRRRLEWQKETYRNKKENW